MGKAFGAAKQRVDAVYQQPFLAHATMEPINCTVHVRRDGCDIWVGTQVPARVPNKRPQKVTGLPPDKITIHNHLIGGGFGRRLEIDMITQAVKIGKQVDAPVKVFWTREEDIQHDMYRPYYYDNISAGLDANGKPIAWQHRIVGSSILARFAPPAFKNGLDADAVEVAAQIAVRHTEPVHRLRAPGTANGADGVLARGRCRRAGRSWWRASSTSLQRRRTPTRSIPADLLREKSPRAANVLDVAAQAAGWGSALPKGQGARRVGHACIRQLPRDRRDVTVDRRAKWR